MFAILIVFVGLIIAIAIAVGAAKLPDTTMRAAGGVVAVGVLFVFIVAASIRLIGADEVGVVVKNVGTSRLKGGAYIAVAGEQGIQADVLEPGWHFWYWPFIYDVRETPLTEVRQGDVGILDAKDGLPLQPGQVIADDWSAATHQQMLDARYFLTAGKGQKGTQATVLTPGKYRLNPELFKVTMVKQTEVPHGEVAVLKANFGKPPSLPIQGPAAVGAEDVRLAGDGEMGVRAKVLPPGKYAINTQAYTVVEIWTTQMIAHFTAVSDAGASRTAGAAVDPSLDERAITVRTSDGYTFPVDVRIEYEVKPQDAPVVVAKLGGDDDKDARFPNALNSAVRAIFRNNAETVRALDYVQQRSNQEQQSLQMLAEEMARFGVTITAVRIGNVGDEKTLGTLLKTQTDREIAKQEQLTFQEQQKAAEQKKLLSRATQESEEEKRLATAAYAAKIADEDKKKRLIEAEAEAQSITIKAKAQADAYELIATQIGKSNAALIEVLKIVGERGIQITPRVMITGGGNAGNASGTALFGTMLDQMVSREDDKPPARTP